MTVCAASSVSPSDPPNTIAVSVGEDAGWMVTVTDAVTGALVDLTGAEGFFTVRRRPTDAVAFIYKRTFNAGGADVQFFIPTQTGLALGTAFFYADFADTINLDSDWSPIVYDLWFVLASGKHKPVVRNGVFKILASVTRFKRP